MSRKERSSHVIYGHFINFVLVFESQTLGYKPNPVSRGKIS